MKIENFLGLAMTIHWISRRKVGHRRLRRRCPTFLSTHAEAVIARTTKEDSMPRSSGKQSHAWTALCYKEIKY